MIIEIKTEELYCLIKKQLKNLFFFKPKDEEKALKKSFKIALERSEYCFSRIQNKYYRKNNKVYFNPFHSAQYSIFLYYLSNTVWRTHAEAKLLADKIYCLNKALNCLDIFYEVEMPDVFVCNHPLGSVMGRAKYGNFFSFIQDCHVGNNKGIYPILGENVRMMSGSKILGNCLIGDNVIIGANAYVKDSNIHSCTLVFGASPNLTIVRKNKDYFKKQIYQ